MTETAIPTKAVRTAQCEDVVRVVLEEIEPMDHPARLGFIEQVRYLVGKEHPRILGLSPEAELAERLHEIAPNLTRHEISAAVGSASFVVERGVWERPDPKATIGVDLANGSSWSGEASPGAQRGPVRGTIPDSGNEPRTYQQEWRDAVIDLTDADGCPFRVGVYGKRISAEGCKDSGYAGIKIEFDGCEPVSSVQTAKDCALMDVRNLHTKFQEAMAKEAAMILADSGNLGMGPDGPLAGRSPKGNLGYAMDLSKVILEEQAQTTKPE